jgi:hypothetical protein
MAPLAARHGLISLFSGPPIGAGGDNWLYQHEIGNDAYVGNQATAMLSSAASGYYVIAEGDNLMFVDQIWPDMKWAQDIAERKTRPFNMTLQFCGLPKRHACRPSSFSMTERDAIFDAARSRAPWCRFNFHQTNVGTFWRLGGIRFRFQPDGKF